MFGIVLASVSTLFAELAATIGKYEVRERKESVYTLGFLNLFWIAAMLLATAFARQEFVFVAASLPTFGARVILEILQTHISILALVRADRSTFGFLRILTIPLLLITDVVIGYEIGFNQIIGVSLIVLSLVFLFINHGIRREGAGFVLFSAINAVATISLYKYDITHFNSVEAEQSILLVILMTYLFFMARFIAKENPIKFLLKPALFLQSASMGLAGVAGSFAISFAPASIVNAAERSSSILASMISGNIYFHEKRFLIKLVSLTLIVAGLIMLVV